MKSTPVDLNFELSLEQQFNLKIMQKSIQKMNREEAISLLMDAAQLLMVKDNAIKSLMKQQFL